MPTPRRKSKASNRTVQRKVFNSLLFFEHARELSQGSRKSSTSSMSERNMTYLGNGNNEELLENAQLCKIRELNDRIAYQKAKRKSFCKLNQLKMMRIRFRGVREKTVSAKRAKQIVANNRASDDHTCEKLNSLSVRDDLNKPKAKDLIENFEQAPNKNSPTKKKKDSVQWDPSIETNNKKSSGNRKWNSIICKLGSEPTSVRPPHPTRRQRSGTFPLSADQCPHDIEIPFINAEQETNADSNIRFDDAVKLPRLSRTDIKVLKKIDASLVRDGTIKNKSNLYKDVDRKQSIFRRNTVVKIPQLPMGRKMYKGGRDAEVGQKISLPQLHVNRGPSKNSVDEATKRRQSMNQSRRVSQFQDRKVSIGVIQQQQNDAIEMKSKRFGFPLPQTSMLLKKRLSETFKELESCRYLRTYRKW